MNGSIWKYELDVIDEQVINMPSGAELLSVQTQNGKGCLWARVNPNNKLEPQTIITHGTGHDVGDNTGDYLGTYQIGGALVFHVFKPETRI